MTMEIFWQVVCGLAGAVLYYALRYMPSGEFNFAAYFGLDLKQLFKGVLGFAVVYGAWSALGHFEFAVPYAGAIPPMSKAVAFVIGFASKKIVDYALRRFEKPA